MKRQRGRRRSGGGGNSNNPNRHFESNGPDVKIRGSAQQVLDKYLQYARDAQTSGERINSEAYLQYAEHYFRVLAKMQPKQKPQQDGAPADGADGGGEKAAGDGSGAQVDKRSKSDDAAKAVEADGKPEAKDDGDAPKPRRRRAYKKRDEAAGDTAADTDDGVMKTLSRGRDDAGEEAASAEEPAQPAK